MALKRQVATIEEVPEAFRGEYKPVEGGVGFALQVDGDEDTTTLKRTLERVKQERNDAIGRAVWAAGGGQAHGGDGVGRVDRLPAVSQPPDRQSGYINLRVQYAGLGSVGAEGS